MAKTNMNDKHQLLPAKIEHRLAELISMGEFDQGDVAHCRTSYWSARADWHKILVDCYESAVARQRAAPAPAPGAAARPTPAPAPAPYRHQALQGIPA